MIRESQRAVSRMDFHSLLVDGKSVPQTSPVTRDSVGRPTILVVISGSFRRASVVPKTQRDAAKKPTHQHRKGVDATGRAEAGAEPGGESPKNPVPIGNAQ